MSTRNDDRGSYRPPRPSTEHQPTRQRATDQEIQKWISRQHGFVPESAWLLHCKELFGLAAPGTAPKENPNSKHSGGSACSELIRARSEEHTSELQSLAYLVCRLLLEKKKKQT